MNNLDHVKNFYPDNYKLDLSETMKAALSKGPGGVSVSSGVSGIGSSANSAGGSGTHGLGSSVGLGDMAASGNSGISGVGYVTEKLYMLLQLYLQNKGWNPSAELLQCFSDLKDTAMLPSAGYLQVLANRLTLDTQGRLIMRENGKIVLPFEHFANAVMLKHMSGPHGLHLSVEATVRAVIESYTIGRENFGMEKEFIIEVVQSCPSPACRYYKNHLGMSPLPFMEQQFPGVNPADFLQHLPHLPPHSHGAGSGGSIASGASSGNSGGSGVVGSSGVGVGASGEVDLTKSASSHVAPSKVPVVPSQLQMLTKQQQNNIQSQLSQLSAAAAAAAHHQQQQHQAAAAAAAAKQQQQQQQQAQAQAQAAAVAQAQAQQQQQQQQQLTAALLQQQQNRALAQQSLEKFSSLNALEKQRVLQQLDPKHFDPMAVAAAAANLQMQGLSDFRVAAIAAAAQAAAGSSSMVQTPSVPTSLGSNIISNNSVIGSSSAGSGNVNNIAALGASPILPPNSGNLTCSNSVNSGNNSSHHQMPAPSQSPSAHSSHSSSSSHSTEQIIQKNVDLLRSNLESIESNKDLLALHNGAWNIHDNAREPLPVGQEKIVRVFAELMRNMARMKTYIRPSMCKPYGKQSESLQKTLLDTIQIVQTLRNCLPAPHIPVTSWKSESEGGTGLMTGNSVAGTGSGNIIGNGGGLMTTNRVENLSN